MLSSAKVVEKLVPKVIEENSLETERVFKNNSLTFSLASTLFNKNEKKGIANFYKILRTLDDYADNGGEEKRGLEEVVTALRENNHNPILDDFFDLKAKYDLDLTTSKILSKH